MREFRGKANIRGDAFNSDGFSPLGLKKSTTMCDREGKVANYARKIDYNVCVRR